MYPRALSNRVAVAPISISPFILGEYTFQPALDNQYIYPILIVIKVYHVFYQFSIVSETAVAHVLCGSFDLGVALASSIYYEGVNQTQ
jgi:hypothetical protein